MFWRGRGSEGEVSRMVARTEGRAWEGGTRMGIILAGTGEKI